MQESRFFSINAQSVRERLNPQATLVPGHMTVAQGSATPESGCTLTNLRTNDDIDNRSVGFDGAVHECIVAKQYVIPKKLCIKEANSVAI